MCDLFCAAFEETEQKVTAVAMKVGAAPPEIDGRRALTCCLPTFPKTVVEALYDLQHQRAELCGRIASARVSSPMCRECLTRGFVTLVARSHPFRRGIAN